MAYCTANAEVKANTGFIGSYSDSTNSSQMSTPTLTEVNYFIDQCDGEIQLALQGIGINTITNSNLSKTVTRYEAIGSAGMVLRRFGNADDQTKANRFLDEYKEWLTKLYSDKNYQIMINSVQNTNTPGSLTGNEQTLGFITHSTNTPVYGFDNFNV